MRSFLKRFSNRAEMWFYNVEVGRKPSVVARELRALAASRPKVIGLVEAVGYDLPALPGYTLIRDRSSESRANIAAYVLADAKVTDIEWFDLRVGWSRTKGPGQHAPRSFLRFKIDGVSVIVAHQPPRYTDNTMNAQREGFNALLSLLAPSTREARMGNYVPRLVMMDANRRKGDGSEFAPDVLASRIKGQAYGERIDCVVGRNLKRVKVSYKSKVKGVRLGSDHHHAMRVKFRL